MPARAARYTCRPLRSALTPDTRPSPPAHVCAARSPQVALQRIEVSADGVPLLAVDAAEATYSWDRRCQDLEFAVAHGAAGQLCELDFAWQGQGDTRAETK